MTNAKFCDIHPSENNVIPKEKAGQLIIKLYDQKNKRYRQLQLDGCIACMTAQVLERASARGIDVQNGWKYETLIPPTSKGGKWKKMMLSPEELAEWLKEADQAYAQYNGEAEEEESAPTPSPARTATKKSSFRR